MSDFVLFLLVSPGLLLFSKLSYFLEGPGMTQHFLERVTVHKSTLCYVVFYDSYGLGW